MAFDLSDGVHYHHVPWGGWYFDEFAAKLDEKLVDKYLEALAPLRPNKSDQSDLSDKAAP